MFGYEMQNRAIIFREEKHGGEMVRVPRVYVVKPATGTVIRRGVELPIYGVYEEKGIATPEECDEFRRIGKPVWLAE